jgi:mono/diheme cytochrome c family protein
MTRDELPPREREHTDPDENVRPIPRLIVGLVLAGAVFGATYLSRSETNASGFMGDSRTLAAFEATPVSNAVSGAQVYAGKCAACHQATGAGLAGIFPPLAGSPWVVESEVRLIGILLHGIQGPIDVLGTTYNGLMPSWKSLSDAELAAVATYVRTTFGNTAGAVSPSTVARVRAETAARTGPWSGGAELLPVK